MKVYLSLSGRLGKKLMMKSDRKLVVLSVVILLSIHILLLFNLRFTAWPEMLSFPYLRNHGYFLYKDTIYPYTPVLIMALSILFKIFGYKLMVLKIFTWAMILGIDTLIFLIVKKLTNKYIFAYLTLIFYVLTQPFLEGNMLWFDLAIVPPILFATLYMIDERSFRNLFIAGLSFGVAALIKQTAGVFLIAGILCLILKKEKIKKVVYFIIGPSVMVMALLIRLITEGALQGFIDWTLIYPFTFWSKFPGYVQMSLSNRQIFILALLILPVFIGLIFRGKKLLINHNFLLLTSYLLLSFVLIYPRFSFFHFQLCLAFMAIIYGLFLSKDKIFLYLLCSAYFVFAIVVIRPVIAIDWQKEARFWSEEDIKLANLIRSKTKPDEKVYLLGLHSGLYVIADRLPPKPWLDNFGWFLEVPGVQEKIIENWSNSKPQNIVVSEPQPGNWYDLGAYRPQKIVNWINDNYKLEDKIDGGIQILVLRVK